MKSESKWIRTKNKMIRPRESKSFCDFWFTLANQIFPNQNESIRSKPWPEVNESGPASTKIITVQCTETIIDEYGVILSVRCRCR